MAQKLRFIAFFICTALLISGFGLPKNVSKKVIKELEKTFEIQGVTMDAFTISKELNNTLPRALTSDNFYRLSKENELLGYAFIDQAPSKTAKFDYLVVFDKALKIKHSKVLIYREERSMTNAIDDLLQSVKILQENQIL